jgi:hypothetical protein
MSKKQFNDVLNQLLELRDQIASANHFSDSNQVCTHATLLDMVVSRPQTLKDLRRIYGIGEAFVKDYGESFLNLLQTVGDYELPEQWKQGTANIFRNLVHYHTGILRVHDVSNNINEALICLQKKRIAGILLYKWLLKSGYLEGQKSEDGDRWYNLTELGKNNGLYKSEENAIVFDEKGQRLCVELTITARKIKEENSISDDDQKEKMSELEYRKIRAAKAEKKSREEAEKRGIYTIGINERIEDALKRIEKEKRIRKLKLN